MLVEQRDLLFMSPAVKIGKILLKCNETYRKVFEMSAKCSKTGDDNSDLMIFYQQIMESRIN